MPRYWVIAPFESKPPGAFDKVWQFDVANSLISIGWSQLGDISKLGREELSNAVASAYPDKPPSTKSLYVNMLWAFYHEVSPGDLVVARRGRKTLAAVGKVIGPAAYAPGKNPAAPHRNFFGVAWQEQPRDRTFATLVFQMRTLVEISEDQYRGLLGPTPPDLAQEGEETADKDAFVLEKYLEEFIVSNFKSIFKESCKSTKIPRGLTVNSTPPTLVRSTYWLLSLSQTPSLSWSSRRAALLIKSSVRFFVTWGG